MKKLILFLIFTTIAIFPQYNTNQKDLARTTFNRKFDQNIISKYFNSSNSEDVKAVLLAISHSEDTNYINQIIKLDFEEYGEYISFALGQLGINDVSENFLLSKLNNIKYIDDILIALGRCGSKKSLNFLLSKSLDYNLTNRKGFYVGLVNYHLNGNTINDEAKSKFILETITAQDKNLSSKLFCLNRVGVDKLNCTKLINIIPNLTDPESVVNAISVLRRSPFIPESIKSFSAINQTDWRVRNELVRLYTKLSFDSEEKLVTFFNYLNDENKNVSRQTATLLRNLNVTENLIQKFNDLLDEFLDKDLESNTYNEVFISKCVANIPSTIELIKKYESKIDKNTIFTVLNGFDGDPKVKYTELKKYGKAPLNNSELLGYVTSLLSVQEQINSEEYLNDILKVLSGDNSAAVYLASAGLDSNYARKHTDKILKTIDAMFEAEINNPQFSEAYSAIIDLVEKLSKEEYIKKAELLINSKVLATKNIGETVLTKPLTKRNDEELFNTLWQKAFLYKAAKIITNKGEFVINFMPEFAPVSVGNFIYLAEKGFFNNVIFHRVVPNFVIQTGDPTGTGWGGPDHVICSEFSMLEYLPGAVGMASSGKDTEGSQWYVMHSHFPHLNRRYTNFGIVDSEYMAVINNVLRNDKVLEVKLIK